MNRVGYMIFCAVQGIWRRDTSENMIILEQNLFTVYTHVFVYQNKTTHFGIMIAGSWLRGNGMF